MITLSSRVNSIEPSATATLKSKALSLKAKGVLIIDLSAGEPDFPTPQVAKDAAIDAIKNNATHYTAIAGIPSLREAIVYKLKQENQLEYNLNQVIVTAGAKHAIYNLLQSICNTGDEVIIPSPYWVSYPTMVQLSGALPKFISTEQPHFKLTADHLNNAITPTTRAIILNSPNNPTGAAYTQHELQSLAGVLQQHPNIIIISDDIYEHLFFHEERFSNILNACPSLYDRTVIINGVSKAYAMTGWRIGYAAGPEYLISAIKKLQSHSTTCACSIAQAASQAALEQGINATEMMRKTFKERADFLTQQLNKISGVTCPKPEGAFYCFPNISGLIEKNRLQSDIDLANVLLEKTGVVVVPGTYFGAPNFIRISYTADIKTLGKALDHLQSLTD